MSCQQAPRLITTNLSATVTPEDPYVFTETIPATPPTLFNAQKTRARLTDTQQQQQTPFVINPASLKSTVSHKIPLAPVNGNASKSNLILNATAARNPLKNFKNVTTIRKYKQQQQQYQQNQQHQQKQQPQQHFQTQHHQKFQNYSNHQHELNLEHYKKPGLVVSGITPKQPLKLLQHTPSLWQTPLLLDTVATEVSPPISPASLPSPSLTAVAAFGPSIQNGKTIVTMDIHGNTVVSSVMTPTPTVSSPPLVTPSAEPLPPSKFLNTTLAQHLHKVESIKKPKKQNVLSPKLIDNRQTTVTKTLTPPSSAVTSSSIPSLSSTFETLHPHSDLNDIPVNVIFRKPQNQCEITRTLLTDESINERVSELKAEINATESLNGKVHINISPAFKVEEVSESLQFQSINEPPKLNSIIENTEKSVLEKSCENSDVKTLTEITESSIALGKRTTVSINNIPAINSNIPTDNNDTPPIDFNYLNNVTIEKLPDGDHGSVVSTIQTDVLNTHSKRKSSSPVNKSPIHQSVSASAPKRNRKTALLKRNHVAMTGKMNFPPAFNDSRTAMAVVKVSEFQEITDNSMLASDYEVPYFIQNHWFDDLTIDNSMKKNLLREERIAVHKSLLRRQASQLLSTHSLQKGVALISRRRLVCVDKMLRKYEKLSPWLSNESQYKQKVCSAKDCEKTAVELSTHCMDHILQSTQLIFLACKAKCADNKACSLPVFDVTSVNQFCRKHAKDPNVQLILSQEKVQNTVEKLTAEAFPQVQPTITMRAEDIKQQQLLAIQHQNLLQLQKINASCKQMCVKSTPVRKRKGLVVDRNELDLVQKRSKNIVTETAPLTPTTVAQLPPLSAVLKRKGSVTSLESIASNSHSSGNQTFSQPAQPHQPQAQHHLKPSNSLSPPALAPLSGFDHSNAGIAQPQLMLNFRDFVNTNVGVLVGNDKAIIPHIPPSNTSKSHNTITEYNVITKNNFKNNDFNNTNLHYLNTNSNSNFTTSGLGSSSSLPSMDDLLSQDMQSICENSSAYASSEDTGLGGLSETELIAGPHDADDIPLGDTHLLEEQDLANVMSSLPEVGFYELFTAVRQDEREEVERALELADKHLKSLQQTISSTDTDFLTEFLDVNLFGDGDLCSKMQPSSPDTSGIDAATMFVDSGSNSVPCESGESIVSTAMHNTCGLVQT